MAAVLALAFALRVGVLWIAPGVPHPDQIYQYFEPAYRLLTGDGIVTWEWRKGIRGWLLPTVIALPMSVGRLVGGTVGLQLPNIVMAALSTTIVWTAWQLGARRSDNAALVAAVAAATWYTLIYFAPRTLSEPIATALLFPAALWLASAEATPRKLAAAGMLVALAVIVRPHYAPAAGVMTLVALERRLPSAFLPVALGGLAALAIGALADLSQGQTPLAWVIQNVQANVVEDKASTYGTEPPTFYLVHWWHAWGWWTPAVAAGFVLGWRVSPALAAAALVNVALHSLIGHKEVRFVFLSEAAIVIIGAIGLAGLAERWKLSPALPIALWIAASMLAATSREDVGTWRKNRPGMLAFEALRHDSQACGLALVGAGFDEVPGRSHLPPGVPMAQFADRDPRVGDPRLAFAPFAGSYNRVFAPLRAPPVGYRPVLCANDRAEPYCLMARPGGCATRPDLAEWDVQAVLNRSGR